MNKRDIIAMTNTELFAAYHDITVQLVKEANHKGGERKGTMKLESWIVDEAIKRFGLERPQLVKLMVINE